MKKTLKKGLSVRGDSLYCPLSFSLDSYWNCLTKCHHCYLRNLNRTWGEDLRPLDVEKTERDLRNGIKNLNPKTPLAHCLSRKKTIRWGNKSDPFQIAEQKFKIANRIFPVLIDLKWTFVIQTKFTHVLADYSDFILQAHQLKLITLLPIISPGLNKDWEIFEQKKTTSPRQRLRYISELSKKAGVPVGVNGEPFIPGFHTEKDFENTLKFLLSYGIKRYNTYNLHLNPLVAKNFHQIGLDIEKIWTMNQDHYWKPILQRLLDLSKKYDILLGCPDFVNSGPHWKERANTCCGIDVPNPTTFNTHFWKKGIQENKKPLQILRETWDGSGNWEVGKKIVFGDSNDFYTLKDAGF